MHVSMLMQIPDVPPELREWTENTLLGLFAGVCYGGVLYYLQTRHEGSPSCPHSPNIATLYMTDDLGPLANCQSLKLLQIQWCLQGNTDHQILGCRKHRLPA